MIYGVEETEESDDELVEEIKNILKQNLDVTVNNGNYKYFSSRKKVE